MDDGITDGVAQVRRLLLGQGHMKDFTDPSILFHYMGHCLSLSCLLREVYLLKDLQEGREKEGARKEMDRC